MLNRVMTIQAALVKSSKKSNCNSNQKHSLLNFNLGLDLFEDDFNFDEAQWTELFKQTDSKPTVTNWTFNNCTFKM